MNEIEIKYNKKRLNLYFPMETYKGLQELSAKENRKPGNLAVHYVMQRVQEEMKKEN